MASPSGPPPGLSRPKSSKNPSHSPQLLPASPFIPFPVVSPVPCHPQSASWAASLSAGLFPPTFDLPPLAQLPQGTQPFGVAAHSAECLPQHPEPLLDNTMVTDLAVFPAPSPSDPWHMAHLRVCAHASAACAACSVAFVCCSCRALRFSPGSPPIVPRSPSTGVSPRPLSPCPDPKHSRSASPALFRTDIGEVSPPAEWDSHSDIHDDDAYARALAECDVCDNSSCPRGVDEPATWTIVVERFDEGTEEHYDCTFRVCGACNRACKRSFMGHKIKSRAYDNSTKENNITKASHDVGAKQNPASRASPPPGPSPCCARLCVICSCTPVKSSILS